MFKSLTRWVAASILSFSIVGVANAVTVYFDGAVVTDYLNIDPTTSLVGSIFSGSFDYTIPSQNSGGSYDNVITSATLTINGTTNSIDFSSALSLNNITVNNGNGSGANPYDTFTASVIDATGSTLDVVNAVDTTGATFAGGSDALPTDFSFLFNNNTIFGTLFFDFADFFGIGSDISIDGDLTYLSTVASAVPEPSVLGLLGLGLVMVSFARRKKAA